MQLISNYLDHIKSYLPEPMQQEVSDELEASIYGQVEDKEESLGRALKSTEIEEILLNIGHPMRVASAYLPGQEVVGKYLFPAYKKALKMAFALTFGLVVLLAIPGILESKAFVWGALSVAFEFFDTALYVFALVTLVFYSLGYYNISLDKVYAWSPKDLNSKSSKLKLSRIETGFELVIYLLFVGWWNDFLTWPSGFLYQGDSVAVALSPEWQSVAWAINWVLVASIIVGIYKFITAKWTKTSLAIEAALSLSAIAICVQISQFNEFIIFTEEVMLNESWDKVLRIVDQIVYSITGFISLISAWEIYSNIKKIIRS